MTKKKKPIVDRICIPFRRLLPAASEGVAKTRSPLRKAWREFVGKSINGHDGRFVGKVVDLMADLAGGRITYAVVSLSGLGLQAGAYSVLPWGVLWRAPLNDHVLSTAPAKHLRRAPRFPRDRWPSMDDSTWAALVYRRCNRRPYWYFTDPVGPPAVSRIDAIIGMTVRNGAGEELGEIHELVIETSEGRIVYAVLSSDDRPRIERKLLAIRCDRLRLDENQQSLLLDVSLAAIRASTGFDKDDWPRRASDDGMGSSRSRADRRPHRDLGARGAERDSVEFVRASELIGRPVDDRQGKELGKIDEFVIDLDSGRIATAVVSVGEAPFAKKKLVAVPAVALSVRGSDLRVVLDVDAAEIERAPEFESDDWPKVRGREWLAAAYDHFGFSPYWDDDLIAAAGHPN